MTNLVLLPFALVASAIAFPAMLFERALPIWPSQEELNKDMPPLTIFTAYHVLKNISTECVRADPQWWSKALCFTILILAILGAF